MMRSSAVAVLAIVVGNPMAASASSGALCLQRAVSVCLQLTSSCTITALQVLWVQLADGFIKLHRADSSGSKTRPKLGRRIAPGYVFEVRLLCSISAQRPHARTCRQIFEIVCTGCMGAFPKGKDRTMHSRKVI